MYNNRSKFTNNLHGKLFENDRFIEPSTILINEEENQAPESVLEKNLNDIPDFQISGKPIRLSDGLLNYVWRLKGTSDSTPESLIAKWAPPFIASSPNVQLDPDRIFIEAKALSAFGPGGKLSGLITENIRLPQSIKLDQSRHLLLMEDVCQCPDLSKWIKSEHTLSETSLIGNHLGEFIGQLHQYSAHHPELALDFNNQTTQHTRLEVLYKNVFNYAKLAQLPNAKDLGKIALDYGETLQKPGKALIMGDLWLQSIFVSGNNLRIIDWELAHYGRPSQDIGHLVAHLWMHVHRAQSIFASDNAQTILESFLKAYRAILGIDFDQVFGVDGVKESSIHFGSEILARTVGIFQGGYLYQGLDHNHPVIQEAIKIAARHILTPFEINTFDALGWRNNQDLN